MGIHWELEGNMLGTKERWKKSSPPPPLKTLKKKNKALWLHVEPSHWVFQPQQTFRVDTETLIPTISPNPNCLSPLIIVLAAYSKLTTHNKLRLCVAQTWSGDGCASGCDHVVCPRFTGVLRRYYYFFYGRNLVWLFLLFPSSLVWIVPAVYCCYGCWLFMADVLQKREVSLWWLPDDETECR
jgi:hypothetical protein